MASRRKTVRVDVPIPSSKSTNGMSKTDDLVNNSATMKELDSPPPFGSPLLPTLMEALLLSIYPATLIVGSLFSTLTVDHDQTPYIAHMQSYHPDNAPSYFAKKSNILNVYFVKVGWAWITLAFALFVFGSRALGPVSWLSAPQAILTKRRLQALARYAVLTAVWYSFTQGFFGAPLIDRGFQFTGGKCEIALSDDPIAKMEEAHMSRAEKAATHAACRMIGGQWKGGHDISGHVFLLVMGSAMLLFEVLPIFLGWAGLTSARQVVRADGRVKDATRVGPGLGEKEVISKDQGIFALFALSVGGVSWWMLLMTAAYFHTWFEKFTGLIVALTAVYLTYFSPRAIPLLRNVLGMPGVA